MGGITLILLMILSIGLSLFIWLLAYASGWVLSPFWIFVAVFTIVVLIARKL